MKNKYFSEQNLLEMDPNSSKQDIKEGLAIPDNGKGDGQRPAKVSKATIARNWCRTFGHKRLVTPEDRYTEWRCLDCGATGKFPYPGAPAK